MNSIDNDFPNQNRIYLNLTGEYVLAGSSNVRFAQPKHRWADLFLNRSHHFSHSCHSKALWTYFALVGGQVAQDIRAQSLVAQAPAAEAAPHLAVFVRHNVVPVPAHQRAPHQVGQLQIGENVLQHPSWQPPGHTCASTGRGSVGRAGGAATGRRCAQAGGASSPSGCTRHRAAPHRRHRPTENLYLTT